MTTDRHIPSWDTLWENFAESAESNPAQRYRHCFLLRLLQAPERLVDVGSGQGDFLRLAHSRFPNAELRGVELSPHGRGLTQQKCPRARLLAWDLDGAEPLPESWVGWATHATCSEVLEHLADPLKGARRLATLLEEGGRLVVSVPAGPMSAFDRHLGHQRHFDSTTLDYTLRQAGFDDVRVMRAGFPFFNLYRLAVMVRGDALLRDASSPGWLAKSFMVGFDLAFRLNLPASSFGWQLFATATK